MKIKFILLLVFFLSTIGWTEENLTASQRDSKESWRGVHIGIGSQKAVEQLTGIIGELSKLGVNVIVAEINYGYQCFLRKVFAFVLPVGANLTPPGLLWTIPNDMKTTACSGI